MLKAPTINEVAEYILSKAKELDKDVTMMTYRDIAEQYSKKQLERLGGITRIIKFICPLTDKDLRTIHSLKASNNYIGKLEKLVGEKQFFSQTFTDILDKTIQPLPKIKPRTIKSSGKVKLDRHIVAMLNDTHIGVIIDSEEIGGINKFDFKQAGRRIAFLIKQTIDYKPHARSEVKSCNLILNGDLIAGIIHGMDTKGIHLSVHQINGAIHILTYAIESLAKEFKILNVYGIAGNHDRQVAKNGGRRAVSEVFDSFSNYIFYALSTAFRNSSHVKFHFPKTAYGYLDLPGGRIMYAHGDHVFSKALGNVGSSINVKGLSTAIKDWNSGELAKGNPPIKLLLLGHVHSYAHFITNDGVEVLVAPSLVGLDAFAHSLTINNSFSGQIVFESTKDFILGDCRLVRLNEADNMKELDKIIPEYKKELKFINV